MWILLWSKIMEKSYRQQRREEATYVENMGQELGPRNWKTHLCENWSRGAKRGRVRSSLVTQGIHRHEDKHTAERKGNQMLA